MFGLSSANYAPERCQQLSIPPRRNRKYSIYGYLSSGTPRYCGCGARLVSTTGLSVGKSETRRPKTEGRPKTEIRIRPCVGGLLPDQSQRSFGLRNSDFLRVSAFGFRIWGTGARWYCQDVLASLPAVFARRQTPARMPALPVVHGTLRVELSCIQATSGLLGVGLNW